jgi:hypothetical protein
VYDTVPHADKRLATDMFVQNGDEHLRGRPQVGGTYLRRLLYLSVRSGDSHAGIRETDPLDLAGDQTLRRAGLRLLVTKDGEFQAGRAPVDRENTRSCRPIDRIHVVYTGGD